MPALEGNPGAYGVSKAAKPKTYELDLLRILVCRGGSFLGEVRGEGSWLSNQVEVPTFVMKSEDASLDQYPKLRGEPPPTFAAVFKTSITKYKITNYVARMTGAELAKISKRRYERFPLDPDGERLSGTTVKVLKKTGLL